MSLPTAKDDFNVCHRSSYSLAPFRQRNQAQKEREGKRLCRAGVLVFKKCGGKKHSFGNGLYRIPSIYGDLGDCFLIVNKRSCHNRPLKLLPPPA